MYSKKLDTIHYASPKIYCAAGYLEEYEKTWFVYINRYDAKLTQTRFRYSSLFLKINIPSKILSFNNNKTVIVRHAQRMNLI